MRKRPGFMFKIWRVVYPLLIHYGALMIIAILGLIVIAITMGTRFAAMAGGFDDSDLIGNLLRVYLDNAVLLTGIGNLLAIPFLLLLRHADKKKYPMGKLTHSAPKITFLLPAFAGIAFCIAGNTLLTLVETFTHQLSEATELENMMVSNNYFEEYLCIAVLAPIGEELAFRGLVYRRTRDFLPAWAAIILSSLAFGVYHGNVLQGVYASLLGCVLAYSYEKFQNILAPILIHMLANATSCLIGDVSWFDAMFLTRTGLIISCIVSTLIGMGLLVLTKLFTKVTREARPEPNIRIKQAPAPVYVVPMYYPQPLYPIQNANGIPVPPPPMGYGYTAPTGQCPNSTPQV